MEKENDKKSEIKEMRGRLHLNLPESIAQLRFALKEFEIRKKVYKIFYRGKSFEFDGFRPYTGEDDMTSIDWKASIRANHLLVKQYKEEEDLKIYFIIDVGENMISGSGKKLKCEYAAEASLALAHMMIVAGHRVGFVLYNKGIEYVSIPRRGIRNFYLFADVLSDAKTYKSGSRINEALDFALRHFDNSVSAVVIVSDFLNVNKETEHLMQLVTSRYETMALVIRDPLDKELPDVSGEFVIENPHTGDQLLIDPKLARVYYGKHVRERDFLLQEIFNNSSIDHIELMTNKNFVPELTAFLRRRMQKRINL